MNSHLIHKQLVPAARRRGFTLVELLLVIAIIGILSLLSLMVLRGAEKDALVARSTSQSQRINQVLAIKWEEYQTRILRFRFAAITGSANLSPYEIERIRSRAIMDLARVEFPNSVDDLVQFPSPESQDDPAGTTNQVDETQPNYWPNAWRDNYVALMIDPTLQPSSLNRMRRRLGMCGPNDLPPCGSLKANGVELWDPNGWSIENEQAECLYAILLSIRIEDKNGIEYVNLRDNEIGDTDNDGRLEVLDAFGVPFSFTYDDPDTATVENDLDLVNPQMSLKVPFIAVSVNISGI